MNVSFITINMNQEIIKNNIIKILQSKKISRVLSGHWAYRSYGKNIYNQTLFEEFGEMPYSKDIDYILLRYTLELKLEITIKTIEKYLQKLQDDIIFYEAIEEKKNLLELALLSLPFEFQKAGYQIDETPTQIKKRKKDIENLETKIWGEKISENPHETRNCIIYLEKKYKKNRHLLMQEDDWNFEYFFKKIEKYWDIEWVKDETSQNFHTSLPDHDNAQENLSYLFFENFRTVEIKREDYIEIFRKCLYISGLKDIEIQIWNGGSISITKDVLLVPESSSYNFLSLQRILCLVYHEIIIHGTTWKNQKRFFWSLRWSKYYEKEEGLASYIESRLLWYYNNSCIPSLCAHSRILAWEILNGSQYWDFIRILRVITKQKTGSTKKSFLRNKIYHSYDDVWTSRKEASYVRWFYKVQRYIQENKDLRYLLLWKLSFERCEEQWEKYISDTKFVLPISISDYIIYHIAEQYIPHKNYSSYDMYMKTKYPDIHNFFQDISGLTGEKKEKLQELLDFINQIIYKNIYPWK